MRVTQQIDAETSITHKLVPSNRDDLNIRYRAWVEIVTRVYRNNGRVVVEENEIWFHDEISLDNLIAELLALKQALNKERNAIDDHIDAIESTAKVC